MEEFKRRFGAQITQLQGEANQKILADKLGISQSAISDYQKGKRVPTLENLCKIAEYQGKLPEHLMAELFGRRYEDTYERAFAEQIRPLSLAEKFALLEEVTRQLKDDWLVTVSCLTVTKKRNRPFWKSRVA